MQLQFSDYRIGLILFGGSFLMVLSGIAFAVFENFWILLLAAVIGVVSATGGDFGPFRAIEESILSQLTTPKTRSDVLAWYVTTSSVGSAIGSEASGRIIRYLLASYGWQLVDVYHTLFWIYTAMGFVNAALVLLLTKACELQPSEEAYSQVPQEDGRGSTELDAGEDRNGASANSEDQGNDLQSSPNSPFAPSPSRVRRYWSSLGTWLAQISAPTRAVMYKLWFLLAIDSIADGMVPYPLTNYYMDQKFHPAKSTLGDVTAVSYFLGAFSSVFAGPLAKKIGLINTMVFTHIPSSAAVLVFPLPGSLWMTVILLIIRAGLNNMDQAPRSAFIAAVVKPEERTAVMGITSMLRTLAATTGPTLTGLLAGNDQFWIAFVAAGAFRLAYDVGLYVMFVNMKLYQHEGGSAAADERRQISNEESLEMEELVSDTDSLVSDGGLESLK
ncbi:hypothetical protein LTR85_011866 [Meristemomyces frigidus]|nr:hypothetical protein LTR85_011866 [Meristemomyces frigidus]